jgi:dihydrofolate reductase
LYPGYEQYWRSILADPTGIQPLTGRPASEEEVAYARFADQTPHVVPSRTLDAVTWKPARIARGIEEIHSLKQQPGRNIHAVGGAGLVSSLLNEDLIDETASRCIRSCWARANHYSRTCAIDTPST